MTAIDTSKLKEGMRVEYELHGKPYLDTIKRKFDWWLSKQNDHTILTPDGSLALGITNVRFPDLQEQDTRNQPILFRNCGQRDEGRFVMKLREWYVIDMGEYLTTVHEKDIIHETKLDLDLKELLLKLNSNLTPHGIDMYSAEIKSLLAAKVQDVSRGVFKDYLRSRHQMNNCCYDAAYDAFLHFTKNEMK